VSFSFKLAATIEKYLQKRSEIAWDACEFLIAFNVDKVFVREALFNRDLRCIFVCLNLE
jgi:hypothetical protein